MGSVSHSRHLVNIYSFNYFHNELDLVSNSFFFFFFTLFYNTVLVLPYTNMNPPRVYTCSHSSVDGCISCFQVLAIENSASMNIVVHVFFF